jgi:hypothetical protein
METADRNVAQRRKRKNRTEEDKDKRTRTERRTARKARGRRKTIQRADISKNARTAKRDMTDCGQKKGKHRNRPPQGTNKRKGITPTISDWTKPPPARVTEIKGASSLEKKQMTGRQEMEGRESTPEEKPNAPPNEIAPE